MLIYGRNIKLILIHNILYQNVVLEYSISIFFELQVLRKNCIYFWFFPFFHSFLYHILLNFHNFTIIQKVLQTAVLQTADSRTDQRIAGCKKKKNPESRMNTGFQDSGMHKSAQHSDIKCYADNGTEHQRRQTVYRQASLRLRMK